ncbi:hypothetical protein QEL91_003131 [Pseudomonas putida]|nr:hypothetical protein [Pseudomonas putida]
MNTPFSNIWFSGLTTALFAWVCYAKIDQLAERWDAVFYLVALTLNTLLLIRSRLAASADVTVQRDNQNLTRQEE